MAVIQDNLLLTDQNSARLSVIRTTLATVSPLQAHLDAIAWRLCATSADASGCEEIKAAPGSGYQLCIERLFIYIGAAITVTVGSGETGPGSVEGDKIGPLGGAAGTYILDVRDRPVALTANKSLTFDASGAGNVCIYGEGFTKTV